MKAGGEKGGRVLDVVPHTVSQDTVHALEVLLQKALVGDVVGIAYVALGPGGAYEGDVVGAAVQMPAIVRGLLPGLEHKLDKIIDPSR